MFDKCISSSLSTDKIMARQCNAEQALDLVMDDDINEVFCIGSDDELGFEDDSDDWLDILKLLYCCNYHYILKIVLLQLMLQWMMLLQIQQIM